MKMQTAEAANFMYKRTVYGDTSTFIGRVIIYGIVFSVG